MSALRNGARGKLVLFQRHGQAAKNVKLRPVRVGMVERLRELAAAEGVGPDAIAAPPPAVVKVLDEWKEISNEPKYREVSKAALVCALNLMAQRAAFDVARGHWLQ